MDKNICKIPNGYAMLVVLRYFKALKDNRSLIMTFAMGELKNRYRNSFFGFLWSILEPLLLLSILYFVFTSVLKSPIPNFAVYLLLGLIMWNFISKSTTMGLNSLTGKSSIISQVYFQRAIPALSSNVTGIMMLGLEFIIFSFFLVGFGIMPSVNILYLPYLVFLTFVITLGLSLPLSVINVFYKDMQFIWNILLSAGFFVHPIIYSLDMLSGDVKQKLLLLPTVRIFDMIHQSVIFGKAPSSNDILYSTVMAFVILFVGYGIYRKLEPRVGEEI